MGFFKLLILCVFMTFQGESLAQEDAGKAPKEYDASGDYIKDCKYATCVGLEGMRWSKQNPFGVAVAVRMGTKPAVTDDQIKEVLTRDFAHYGIKQIKFFYEQNDTPATGIYLHVRGGTEGIFLISNVRKEVKGIAERAKNKNPALITGQARSKNSD